MKVSLPIIDMENFNMNDYLRVDHLLEEMHKNPENNAFIKSLKFFQEFIVNLEKSLKETQTKNLQEIDF